jgi:hypothetical protein
MRGKNEKKNEEGHGRGRGIQNCSIWAPFYMNLEWHTFQRLREIMRGKNTKHGHLANVPKKNMYDVFEFVVRLVTRHRSPLNFTGEGCRAAMTVLSTRRTSQFHSITSAGHIPRMIIYPNAAPICQCVLGKYDIWQIITPSVD